jgi:translation initiation factor IF-2
MTTDISENENSKSLGPKNVTSVGQQPIMEIPSAVTVGQLAALVNRDPIEVIKQLMRNGIMANINQVVDYDTASIVVEDFGYKAQALKEEITSQPITQQIIEEDSSLLQIRPPVVTVLGHVDHGKTSLLDVIRNTNVAEAESGGITQHIGAYKVTYEKQDITFIDTPGHEAFTAMRVRGSRVTDIAVLVIAADDGMMPQTIEAIDHAKAAGVPIVVAINKIDKPDADPDKVKRQLAERDLLVEDWGGDIIAIAISAKDRQGINELLSNILVVAEIGELKANPNRPAAGVIVEAQVDKSKGPVATVLVQNGTLMVGDSIVVGVSFGKVRAMLDHAGQRVDKAGPSTPVEVLGLKDIPGAGDSFIVVANEKNAKQIVRERLHQQALDKSISSIHSLEEVSSHLQSGKIKELSLVIKTDVQGSIDAVRNSLERLTTEQSKVKIIRIATGSITESDILLAIASGGIIVGFNTRIEPGAAKLAEQEGIDIRFYNIIYKLIDDFEKAIAGLLEPEKQEVIEGHADVRTVFSVGRQNKIAGLYVTDGKITRNSFIRVTRDGKLVADGKIASLKRFKDDVREVLTGYECGIGIENFVDFNEGDFVESYLFE